MLWFDWGCHISLNMFRRTCSDLACQVEMCSQDAGRWGKPPEVACSLKWSWCHSVETESLQDTPTFHLVVWQHCGTIPGLQEGCFTQGSQPEDFTQSEREAESKKCEGQSGTCVNASVLMTMQRMTWMLWPQMLPSSIRRTGLCPSCW